MQRRQAALQQCGLVPVPRKDLSQLEQELDRRFGHAATREWEHSELSTAEKVRREWEAKNEIQPAKQGGDEIVEEATRGTSPNRRSIRSLTTESSPPALSPATTASSLPSVATPRDSEWRSGIGRDPEGLDVVYETIPESPDPTAPKRRMSTRVFRSNKRNSTSSRKSTDSERSLRWSATAKDLSFRPYDRPGSGGPTLPVSVILDVRVPRFTTPVVFVVRACADRQKRACTGAATISHRPISVQVQEVQVQIRDRQSWVQEDAKDSSSTSYTHYTSCVIATCAGTDGQGCGGFGKLGPGLERDRRRGVAAADRTRLHGLLIRSHPKRVMIWARLPSFSRCLWCFTRYPILSVTSSFPEFLTLHFSFSFLPLPGCLWCIAWLSFFFNLTQFVSPSLFLVAP